MKHNVILWALAAVVVSLAVTITGINLDFNGPADDQSPIVDFGAGVTVGSTTVSSDTSLVVQVTIAADATLGWRPVSVTLADGSVMTILVPGAVSPVISQVLQAV